jgi:vacuolar-type H+-ATPase subunit H
MTADEREEYERLLKQKEDRRTTRIIISIIVAIIVIILIMMWGLPLYGVYQRLQVEALLAHAQAAKEVAVAEAKAKMESAELLAQAEVKRAEGVAKANKIIGDSLKDNEAYLRYLWITDVCGANVDKTVVYIPTETNMPLLEANRFKYNKAEK